MRRCCHQQQGLCLLLFSSLVIIAGSSIIIQSQQRKQQQIDQHPKDDDSSNAEETRNTMLKQSLQYLIFRNFGTTASIARTISTELKEQKESPAAPSVITSPTEDPDTQIHDCPCFSQEWPEFVRAIEDYKAGDSCYTRTDGPEDSTILALETCERGFTAYMSYDFQGGTETRYCGDSMSNRYDLTAAEGLACEELLRSQVGRTGNVCDNNFKCTDPAPAGPSVILSSPIDNNSDLSGNDCPCLSQEEWPEFVRAIEEYAPGDSCYTRTDPDYSSILAIDTCQGGLTAYMSYNFRDNTESRYCGDSSSNRKILTPMEGLACEELLRLKVESTGNVCDENFLCR